MQASPNFHCLKGKIGVLLALSLFVAGGAFSMMNYALAAQLLHRELKLSDNRASQTATYQLTIQPQTAVTTGSIRIQFCSNSPLHSDPCTPPPGLSASSVILSQQSGMTGFSISGLTTPNSIILTRVPVMSVAADAQYTFTNIINPNAEGTYYTRVYTYGSVDATGPDIDYGGMAFTISGGLMIHTTVPPYLLFCVANTIAGMDCDSAEGNYIDFGDFSSTKTSFAQTSIVIASNADYGFTVSLQGTTMTSGINTIAQLSSGDISRKGVSQFGLNLRSNTTPAIGADPQGLGLSATISPGYSVPNVYRFNNGDTLLSANDPDMEKYTVSYITNVAAGQAPGIYVSTLTYIALASF